MNERIAQLLAQAHLEVEDVKDTNKIAEIFAKLIIQECVNCCDEVAEEADAMKDSKFVTDAGRMLHEGMWGGATNSGITIKNRFGVE